MNSTKPICKYGEKCYRKNPQHLEQFSHVSSDADAEAESEKVTQKNKAKVAEKVKKGKKGTTKTDNSEKELDLEESDVPKKRSRLDEYFNKESSGNKDALEEDKPSTSSGLTKSTEQSSTSNNEDDCLLDPRDEIKSKFRLQMPEDFYDFWEFAKVINAKNPAGAFSSTLGLHLVGPYDVLAGKTRKVSRDGKQPNFLRHWRYYYDPPEFMTVIRGDDKSQFHMGYYRDDPKEMPAFVGSNKASEDCSIKSHGENIFAAVSWFIDNLIKQSGKSKSLLELQTQLKKHAAEKGYSLEQLTPRIKERNKKVVSKTFHGAGIVVPVDKNGVGYRELPSTPTELRKILKKIVESKTAEERDKNLDPLSEIVTFVQFANDECDYGEGLELGIDLLCYGGEQLHSMILNLLPLAYQLLRRHEYSDVIVSHLANRKKGPPSTLDELASCS